MLEEQLSTLEALLFVSPDGVEHAALARATGIELARIEPLLESLMRTTGRRVTGFACRGVGRWHGW